ncbi:GRIP and coiled-coil domain-containing protein 2 isoform X2 [Ictalurus punctatus]|uniref:GRIP and coiled-coil domain-containing protein 2 isoform X2 n=1 Tax=Ictalurus punctatus TaxID=7998 RepID=A0A9F7TFR9_ICTPU|nr:GRIP and coiled-coil domain-containing protein 2 isoform X2 [Ictalurus punctatus]
MNTFCEKMSEDNLPEQLKQFISSHGGGLVVNCESVYSMMYSMHSRLERLEAEREAADGRKADVGHDVAESQPDEKSSSVDEQKAALEKLFSGTELLSLSTSDRSGQVEDSEEGVSKFLIQDLVNKNQELKEEIYSLKKEVETLKNQLSQILLSQEDRLVSVSDGALHQLAGQAQSQVSREVEHVPETLEALTDVGELQEKHESLEARVERLEGERDDILHQLKQLKTQLVDAVTVDRKKVYEVEPLDMGPVNMSESSGLGEELSKSEATLSQTRDSFSGLEQQLRLQTADIRSAVQKLLEEVQNMKQELLTIRLEQKRSPDNEMQDKLDSLQSKLDTVMASSSSMLSWSLQQEDQDSPLGKEGAAEPAWLSAMADLSMKTSKLFQHFENLQSIVTGLMKQETSDRTFITDTTSELTSDVHIYGYEKLHSTASPLREHRMKEQSHIETTELTSDVQGTVLQLQAGREKLHSTASPLREHRMQEQSHIETTELTSDVQGTVLQLQAGREKLHSTASPLREHRMQEQSHIETTELTSDVQGTVLQLQAGREKLQSTASPLREHHMQEQSHIETTELTSDAQGTVLQFQAGREKLHSTASPLREHHMQEQSHIETTELTSDVQGTVLQLQAGREKLQSIASPLREHRMQEQSHIETTELTSDVPRTVLPLQAGREKLHSIASPLREHRMQEQSHIATTELTSDVQGTVLPLQAGREKLHSIASPLREHRIKEQSHIETTELTSDVQGTVLPLQAGREKLHSTASPLREHRMQEQSHIETTELTSDVQGTVLQLQAEFGKLRSTTTQLMKDHMQEQSHIEHLYKTMKELDEKADKKAVKIVKSIKADMQALDTKVLQCDTKIVMLNRTFQDLLTGHEDHCHKVIEKLFRELDFKLNYTELDPLKKQLEDYQMRIYKELQVQRAPESDDAAGLKKQLANFNCLSCDRPVDMNTPGPRLLLLPELPSLLSPKDHRRLRTCTNLDQCERSPTEWSMEQTMVVRVSDSSGSDRHVYKTSEVRVPAISPKEDDCKNKEMVNHSQLLQQPETPLICHGSNCLETEKQWFIEESIPQTLQCRQPRKPDGNND